MQTDDDMSGTAATPNKATPPTDSMTLRVLTVNTHKGFSSFNRRFILHDLREAVREVGADIVFLQEVQGVHRGHARHLADYPQAPHYEFLADQIWGDFAYGRNAIYPHGDHGNAVLSKFPILSYENRDISIHGPERRGMLHCVLDLPNLDRRIHVVCVHLGLREGHRRRQLELLAAMMREEIPEDSTVIVAGDFNDWRRRANQVLARCGMQEVFQAANGTSARSFPARFPMLQLDRIYVRNATRHRPINLHRHPWSRLSDHAPLAAEVTI